MINPERVMNGTTWKCAWPWCWNVVIQWIGINSPDEFAIMTTDELAMHGGTCRNIFVHDGLAFRTKKQVIEWLEKYDATESNIT